MIGMCEVCDRKKVPVALVEMGGVEGYMCYLCQGEDDPDPHGEIEVDTSEEACAAICMLVTNPGDKERPLGWQHRVNDLIRELRFERNDLREKLKAQPPVTK